MYSYNANTAWFDNISLVREVAQTFRHDRDGNVVGVTSSELRDTTMRFDLSSNNLIDRLVTPDSGTFEFRYDRYNQSALCDQQHPTGRPPVRRKRQQHAVEIE